MEKMQKQLDSSLKEVEGLKEARERQTQMVSILLPLLELFHEIMIHLPPFLQVEAVVRQRDMYRVLLANTGQTPVRNISTISLWHDLCTTQLTESFSLQLFHLL